MSAVAVVGKSVTSGHDGFTPRPCIAGNGLHTINGNPVHMSGDPWPPHSKPGSPPHGAVTVSGNSKHTINGVPVANVGDSLSCGDMIVAGDPLHSMD